MMVYGSDATLYQITLDTCILTYYYYYTRLTASFLDNLGKRVPER